MRRSVIAAGGALALGLGIVCAPAAAAQTAGYSETECSEQFRVPWAADAWNGTNKVAVSPFGTADIYCVSFHGQTDVYQLDDQGRKHDLGPLPVIGLLAPNVYFWNPVPF